jgi:hypothetical protein
LSVLAAGALTAASFDEEQFASLLVVVDLTQVSEWAPEAPLLELEDVVGEAAAVADAAAAGPAARALSTRAFPATTAKARVRSRDLPTWAVGLLLGCSMAFLPG